MKTNFKQTVLKLALAFAFVLGIAGLGVNSYAASATANATATVLAPIAISKTADLLFGSFSTSAAGQTVVIDPAGARTLTGALGASTTVGAASFNVTGDSTHTYIITLPDTVNITTGDSSAPETMAVSTFTSNPSAEGTLTDGAQTLKVGATLTTAALQTPGAYTGTFDVIVEYN